MRDYTIAVPRRRDPAKPAHTLASDPQPQSSTRRGSQARVLALDVGSRTIGQAVSDPLGITAQGLDTIRRRNKRADFGALERTIRRFGVAEIVVGYPLRLSGSASAQSDAVAAFAEELRKRFGLPVHLWDERLTSVEANRLLRDAEVSIERRAAAVDRMAATLILQSFLDARSNR